jgi:hypothetical protein
LEYWKNGFRGKSKSSEKALYLSRLGLPFTHKSALPTIATFEHEAVTHQL